MIEITKETISPEQVVNRAKTNSSGCVVTYVGVIRDYSQGKPVLSVEYQDSKGNAEKALQGIAERSQEKVATGKHSHIPQDRQAESRRDQSGCCRSLSPSQ